MGQNRLDPDVLGKISGKFGKKNLLLGNQGII